MQTMHKQINLELLLFIGLAFLLSYIPLISIPFTWFMTFFHEISHGIAALLTGGSIIKINLYLNGSGLCYTSGGNRFVILQAGYIGAVVWGILIYSMAKTVSHRYINSLVVTLAVMIAASALLYGRDLLTWLILSVLFILFVSVAKLHLINGVKSALQFIGIYIILDAVRAPLHLIDARHFGDAASLSDLTGVPEIVWIIFWLGAGLSGLFYLWKAGRGHESL